MRRRARLPRTRPVGGSPGVGVPQDSDAGGPARRPAPGRERTLAREWGLGHGPH
jgi:hypothetical protein